MAECTNDNEIVNLYTDVFSIITKYCNTYEHKSFGDKFNRIISILFENTFLDDGNKENKITHCKIVKDGRIIESKEEERIKSAKEFSEGLENLFNKFYEKHEPSYFIFVEQTKNLTSNKFIKVFNGLYSVGMTGKRDEFIDLNK